MGSVSYTHLSKKRLYEIAKEVGVESKVVVAKAQELGLSVKSHSSSVEEADANRIASSLKGGTAKAESKPAPKATPTPKEEKVAPKVEMCIRDRRTSRQDLHLA